MQTKVSAPHFNMSDSLLFLGVNKVKRMTGEISAVPAVCQGPNAAAAASVLLAHLTDTDTHIHIHTHPTQGKTTFNCQITFTK